MSPLNFKRCWSWILDDFGITWQVGLFWDGSPIKKLTQLLSFVFQSPFCLLKHGLNHLHAPCFTKDPNMGMGQVTYDYHILGGITFKNHQSQLWLWAPGPQTKHLPQAHPLRCRRTWVLRWDGEINIQMDRFMIYYIYMRKGIWNKFGIYNESIVCVCTYILYNLIHTFGGLELGIYWKYHWNITGIFGFNPLMGIWMHWEYMTE